MKYNFLTILLLLRIVSVCAGTVQIPVTLNNDSFSSGVPRLFSVVLPLAPGALKELKNLQISDADGAEINSQSEVVLRHPDGTPAWVRMCGLIDMGKRRRRQIFVEYGSDVLNSGKRGIILAETGSRMLIDTGVLVAEFDLNKFALPEKISVNGDFYGSFAPFSSEVSRPRVTIVEPGPWHLVLQLDLPEKPEAGSFRIHFYNGLAEMQVEYFPAGVASAVSPIGFICSKGGVFSEKRSGSIVQFDFSGRRAAVRPVLTGILPRWHLERAGVIPRADVMIPELQKFEAALIADMGKFPEEHRAGNLLEAFFRTGELKWLNYALLSRDTGVSSRHLAILSAYGAAASKAVFPEIDRTDWRNTVSVLNLFHSIKEWNTLRLRCAEYLAAAFDRNSGEWFTTAANHLQNAEKLRYITPENRIRVLSAMLEASRDSVSRKYDFAGIAARGLRRIIHDGVTPGVRRSPEIFDLLHSASEFYQRHPEHASALSAENILRDFCESSGAPLQIRLFPENKLRLIPERIPAVARLCSGSSGGLRAVDSSGRVLAWSGSRPEYSLSLPVGGCVISSGSGRPVDCLVSRSGNYAVKLAAGEVPLELIAAPFVKFSFELPSGQKFIRLRAFPLIAGERVDLRLVSPSGKEYYLSGSGGDNSSVVSAKPLIAPGEPGEWQLFIHVTCGGVSLLPEGVNEFCIR